MQAARSLALATLVAVLGAVAAPASATSPSLPVRAQAALDGVPAVGATVALRVQFAIDLDQETVVTLHASPGIQVLGPASRTLPAGTLEVAEAWTVRAAQAGFWSLALSSSNGMVQGPCCGYGWSGEGAGDWIPSAGDAFGSLPDPEPRPTVTAEPSGTGALVRYRVEVASWLDGATLVPQVGPGTLQPIGRDSRAVSLEGQVWEREIHVDGDGRLLAYTSATYHVPFPAPQGLPGGRHTHVDNTLHGELHCENHRLERDGDRAAIVESWPCDARSAPAWPVVGGLLALGLLAWMRRARGRVA